MNQKELYEMIEFVLSNDYENWNEAKITKNLKQIQKYMASLDQQDTSTREIVIMRLIRQKLSDLRRNLETVQSFLYDKTIVKDNVCECIVQLIQNRNLKTRLEIARTAYRELGKYLHYDISYTQVETEQEKRKIVEKPIDCENTTMFTYVVCSQWSKLYSHILKQFDIDTRINHLGFHQWVEMDLDDKNIIIADATEYLGGHIDFSTCKSNSATTGFLILPKEMSGVNLRKFIDFPTSNSDAELKKEWLDKNKTILFNLDINLHYANKDGYSTDIILNNMDLFNDHRSQIPFEEASNYLNQTIEFFKELRTPNNMDGYEIYSYYREFFKRLPQNIVGAISMKSLFVKTSEYRPHPINFNYLHATGEYLEYLSHKIEMEYSKYLKGDSIVKSSIYENIKNGIINESELVNAKVDDEMNQAIIQFMNLKYYAVNQLSFYDNFGENYKEKFQLYDPLTGKISFVDNQSLEEYKRKVHIK